MLRSDTVCERGKAPVLKFKASIAFNSFTLATLHIIPIYRAVKPQYQRSTWKLHFYGTYKDNKIKKMRKWSSKILFIYFFANIRKKRKGPCTKVIKSRCEHKAITKDDDQQVNLNVKRLTDGRRDGYASCVCIVDNNKAGREGRRIAMGSYDEGS